MIVRGLLARSLLGSRHSQFRFAEDTKVVKQAGGKPQPPAKKLTDIKDPVQPVAILRNCLPR